MSSHRNIIDGNLVSLCQFTRCNEILIDRCTELDVITREDRDEIEKEGSPYNRNRIFYKIIWLKDEAIFRILIQIMKEKNTVQSSDVLKILEQDQSRPSIQKSPEFQTSVEPEGKSVWFDVHDPITSFVGRENELKELHGIVIRNADKDTQVAVMSQLTSVSGMGGIGKTTLAREYAKRYASYFNNNIIWINAESTSSTEESFRKLAEEISDRNENSGEQNVIPISKVIKDTFGYLSRRKCLFIFDNVEEYKITVSPFIPKSYEPGKIRPYILMTSRKQRLVDDCKVFRLDILDIEDAEKYIKSKLQKCMGQINDVTVRKLANELQCLPLALQQAVAYIQNRVHLKSFFPGKETNQIHEYLKLLEENPKVPLSHKYQDETMDDYSYTVMRTWDVTLKAIEREEYGSQAIQILEMLSYFHPHNIDIEQFDSAFSEEELQVSCVILEQYSLINQVQKYISIHRLVQQVIRVYNKDKNKEEYLLGRCLSIAAKLPKWYYIDNTRHMYWNIWQHILRYENLVIKFWSILGRNFVFTNMNDLRILNSSLEILESNVTQYELRNLYYIFIISVFDHREIISGDVPDWYAQNAMCRLNTLIGLGHYDSISNILSHGSSWVKFYPATRIPKFVRELMQVISNYCYEHSVEIITRHDVTAYHLVKFWLKVKNPRQCRLCFKLLVLETSVWKLESGVWKRVRFPQCENNMAIGEYRRHLVFENFHLFNKYMLQSGIAIDEKEREFMREVLYFCRSLSLDTDEIERMEKVDVLLCNILCLLLLEYDFVHEILSCVYKISVQMRNEFTKFQNIKERRELWSAQYLFRRTVRYIIFTLDSAVLIGTTPLVSSKWAYYVEKIIKFIGTFEKIVQMEVYTEETLTSCLPELNSTSCELEDCCN